MSSGPIFTRPVQVPTYDGSGQAVHPCVIDIAQGFQGYRYWMAMTPYPFGEYRYENPSLRASHDGYQWRHIEGIPDPIIEAPRGEQRHHSDPVILLQDGLMYMVYRTTDMRRGRSSLWLVRSNDLRTWSEPDLVLEGEWLLSPAICVVEGRWRLWYVDLQPVGQGGRRGVLKVMQGPSLLELGPVQRCEVDLGEESIWHLEVKQVGSEQVALVNCFRPRREGIKQTLRALRSSDGLHWHRIGEQPILSCNLLGWSARVIYKSSFVCDGSRMRVWYSASSWAKRWRIGYMETNADFAERRFPLRSTARVQGVGEVAQDCVAFAKYQARRLLR